MEGSATGPERGKPWSSMPYPTISGHRFRSAPGAAAYAPRATGLAMDDQLRRESYRRIRNPGDGVKSILTPRPPGGCTGKILPGEAEVTDFSALKRNRWGPLMMIHPSSPASRRRRRMRICSKHESYRYIQVTGMPRPGSCDFHLDENTESPPPRQHSMVPTPKDFQYPHGFGHRSRRSSRRAVDPSAGRCGPVLSQTFWMRPLQRAIAVRRDVSPPSRGLVAEHLDFDLSRILSIFLEKQRGGRRCRFGSLAAACVSSLAAQIARGLRTTVQ